MQDTQPGIRIFVDLEYCYPDMKKTDPRPTSKDKRQIVQIAAIVYDVKSGQELAAFDKLAKPAFETSVTPFFEELTGITQTDIEKKAISFQDALTEFKGFCGNYPIWTFDKDQEVFEQNCRYFSIPFPFNEAFTRVKTLLPGWDINPSEYSSGTLYKAAGLSMEGHVHNALHDVRSMAAAVRHFENIHKDI